MTGDSKILGVSVRAWITVLLVSTVCSMSLAEIEVKEPLYSLAGMAVGFYLGQKIQKDQNHGGT